MGILEIPPGFTARTDEWIFPASTQGKSEAKLKAHVAPIIDISWNITEESTMMKSIPQKNESAFNEMSELILQNTMVITSNQMDANDTGDVIVGTKAGTQSIRTGGIHRRNWLCPCLPSIPLCKTPPKDVCP